MEGHEMSLEREIARDVYKSNNRYIQQLAIQQKTGRKHSQKTHKSCHLCL